MRRALSLAARGADLGEVPVGAVIIRDEQVIGEAHNRPIANLDPSAHAEILALRAAAREQGNYRLPGATLYVTLEPCAMCMGAMLHARLERLVFGAHDPNSGCAGSVIDLSGIPQFNHRLSVCGGVLASECQLGLRAFFQQRR